MLEPRDVGPEPADGELWTTSTLIARTGMAKSNLARWARRHGIERAGLDLDSRELQWPALAVWRAWRTSFRGNRSTGRARSDAARLGWEGRRFRNLHKEDSRVIVDSPNETGG